MLFERLKLKDFRNIGDVDWSLSPGVNILVGPNGQGKTNLIEALYLLSRGESFRFCRNEHLVRHGASRARISLALRSKGLSFQSEALIEGSKKTHSLNDKRKSLSSLAGDFSVVLFSPESLAAIKEGGEQRRTLVDELLANQGGLYQRLIQDYRRVLRSRNRVLRQLSEGPPGARELEAVLDSLEPTFLDLARRLSWERICALRNILPDFQRAMRDVQKRSVDVGVEYLVSDQNALALSEQELFDRLIQRLQQLKSAERASGTSLVGPHKHDIRILFNGNDSRIFCSQGQQRALILSFKIAQIVYHKRIQGIYPVLMLDDVLSELDAEKRESLISFLKDLRTQIFITTTELSLPQTWNEGDCRVVQICEGQLACV